jgi:hypothetical protein
MLCVVTLGALLLQGIKKPCRSPCILGGVRAACLKLCPFLWLVVKYFDLQAIGPRQRGEPTITSDVSRVRPCSETRPYRLWSNANATLRSLSQTGAI